MFSQASIPPQHQPYGQPGPPRQLSRGGKSAGSVASEAAVPVPPPILSSAGRELLLDLKRSSNSSNGETNKVRNVTTIPILPTYNTVLVQKCLYDIQTLKVELNDVADTIYNRSRETMLDGDTGKPIWELRPYLAVLEATVDRLKRCLMAYHKFRLNIIRTIVQLGGIDMDGNYIVSPGGSTLTAVVGNDNIGDNIDADENNRDGPAATAITGNVKTAGPPLSTNKAEIEFAIQYMQLREMYATTEQQLPYLYRPPIPSGTSSSSANGTSQGSMIQVRVVGTVAGGDQQQQQPQQQQQQQQQQVVLPDSGTILTLCPGSMHYLRQGDCLDLIYDGVLEVVE